MEVRRRGKRERTRYTRYAEATFRKDRRANIRLSSKDRVVEATWHYRHRPAIGHALRVTSVVRQLDHSPAAAGRLAQV